MNEMRTEGIIDMLLVAAIVLIIFAVVNAAAWLLNVAFEAIAGVVSPPQERSCLPVEAEKAKGSHE